MKSATFTPEIKQFAIPDEIKIEGIDFIRDNFIFITKLGLTIQKGNKILIQGPSGCGKTTFLDLLQGKMEGMSFSERIPRNYSSSYLEYTDQLRDLPLIDISLRELCSLRNKRDSALMMCCLDICELTAWKANIGIDDKISGKTSTGEKRRLVLALMVLYPLFLSKKQVLILDEPELGLDPPLAYTIIKNILNITEERGITTYIVSHLENIHEKFNWDVKLDIDKGRVRVSGEKKSLTKEIGEILTKLNKNVSAAESFTSGSIAKEITSTPGASSYFSGSIVAYTKKIKSRILGVPQELIKRHGVVSREVAEAMSIACKKKFGTDFALASTGLAGPGNGTSVLQIGTACFSIAGPNSVRSWKTKLEGTRQEVVEKGKDEILTRFREILLD